MVQDVYIKWQAKRKSYIDGLQHDGAMSTKPVFEKIAKIQKSYVPLWGHTTFMLLTQYFAMM